MKCSYILFDLDGTLTDPQVGITTAVSKALAYFGIEEAPENLTKFIGPPLTDSFQEFYGLTFEQSLTAIEQFRLYFLDRGWKENIPYAGIHEMLRALQQAGKHLLVASSKPEVSVRKILNYFGMDLFFEQICGGSMDESEQCRKPFVIRKALTQAGITDLDDCVMVGDRRHDVDGAHEIGMKAVGVEYGFGNREELENAGAEYIVPTVQSLTALLLN